MTMISVDSKTDKLLLDVLRKLNQRNKLPIRQTKEQFVADAISYYVAHLKSIKVV